MQIPQQFLQKILRILVRSGVLTSTRGIGGGFRLARPPADIVLREIVAPFEDNDALAICPFGNPDCGASAPCPVHDKWTAVHVAYRTFVETTTLEQLANEPPRNFRLR